MNEELENKLKELSPEFLRELGGDEMKTCMAYGFECNDGWYKPLEKLCLKAEEMNKKLTDKKVVAKQIKSKFGNLCVYFDICEETDTDDMFAKPRVRREQAQELYDEFFEAVQVAMSECEEICELCGSTEDIEYKRYIVLCKKCREERDERYNNRKTES